MTECENYPSEFKNWASFLHYPSILYQLAEICKIILNVQDNSSTKHHTFQNTVWLCEFWIICHKRLPVSVFFFIDFDEQEERMWRSILSFAWLEKLAQWQGTIEMTGNKWVVEKMNSAVLKYSNISFLQFFLFGEEFLILSVGFQFYAWEEIYG